MSAAARAADTSPDNRQALDDAWWTGPLLAASASTLPQGHFLVEPYVYDVITYGRNDAQGHRVPTTHRNDFGSQSYIIYGLVDRVSVGLIPRFGFEKSTQGPDSSAVQVGDLSLQTQYRLTLFHEGSWVPTISVLLSETFPTGKYDRLDAHPADGFGAGAYTTTASLYTQDYFWLGNGRILRTRLNASYAISNDVALTGVSVYGTGVGFKGRASLGNSVLVDSSGEYSVTSNWVLALDLVYQRNASTRVVGSTPITAIAASSGPSWSFGIAPAIEYNFNSRIGIIAGARLIPTGRDTSLTVTPVAALNMVF